MLLKLQSIKNLFPAKLFRSDAVDPPRNNLEGTFSWICFSKTLATELDMTLKVLVEQVRPLSNDR